MIDSRNCGTPKRKPVLSGQLLAVLLAAAVLLLAACGKKQEPLRAPTEGAPELAVVSINTAYGTLEFPEELSGKMRHTEVTEGVVAMEIFYMLGNDGERELFRIYYADAHVGIQMGYLNTESGEIPVSYSVCEYQDSDFSGDEDKKLYHSMMDAFSVVLNSIYDDARFSETRAVEPVGTKEAKLKYWTVTLPENVQYEETVTGDTYRVDFYGEVSGERIDLYFIGLGDMAAETVLGMYMADGMQKPVAVETYSMEAYEIWPEEDLLVIYGMMDSVNSVIQAIVSDANFAESTPGM